MFETGAEVVSLTYYGRLYSFILIKYNVQTLEDFAAKADKYIYGN